VSDPDYGADSRKIIISRGFEYEEHHVTTRDGYILTVFRLVKPGNSNNIPSNKLKSPVLIVHGIFSSSRDFIIADPKTSYKDGDPVGNSLGFELSIRNYDVWLVNCRGNTYSQNHTHYLLEDGQTINQNDEYWDFSHADIAQFDVPAVVDHVLKTTGRQTVAYIGHSRGTGAMFAAMSMFPSLNQKVKPFIALSPVVFAKHASPLIFNLPIPAHVTGHRNFPINQREYLPDDLKRVLCCIAGGYFCANILNSLGGDGIHMFNHSRMPVYFSRVPAGSSAKDIRLFQQEIDSGRFARYDYGHEKNTEMYGSGNNPDYNLKRISSREIYLIRGAADILADGRDVATLKSILGSRIREDIVVPVKDWGHMAMLFGQELGTYVVTPIIRILGRYS
jgi:lysosomal acid lipase/cholesteryl ester hydrolase